MDDNSPELVPLGASGATGDPLNPLSYPALGTRFPGTNPTAQVHNTTEALLAAAMPNLYDYVTRPPATPLGEFPSSPGRLPPEWQRGSALDAIPALTDVAGLALPVKGTTGLALFGGLAAKTADVGGEAIARRMALTGMHSAEDIYRTTGWFLGRDNAWRHVLDNEGVKLHLAQHPNFTNWVAAPKAETKLGDMLDHPSLFEAYPEFRNIPVKQVNGFQQLAGVKGGYNSAQDLRKMGRKDVSPLGELYISSGKPEDVLDTLTHELQHLIQNKEGFAQGSSTQPFTPTSFSEANKLLNANANLIRGKLKEAGTDGNLISAQMALKYRHDPRPYHEPYLNAFRENPGLLQALEQHTASSKEFDNIASTIHRQYQSVAGETEARNASLWQKLSPEDRKLLLPWKTEDIPRAEQTLQTGPRGTQADEQLRLELRPTGGEFYGEHYPGAPRALTPQRVAGEQHFHDFTMHNEGGDEVGSMTINAHNPKHLYIEWIGAYGPSGAGSAARSGVNALGPKEIRSLTDEVRRHFPEAETISGFRASGARWHGKPYDATDPRYIASGAEPVIRLRGGKPPSFD